MTVVTRQSRERHAAVKERKSAARDDRNRLKAKIDAAEKLGDQDAVETFKLALVNADQEYEVASELESVLLRQQSGVEHYGGESFLENPDTIRMLEQLASSTMPIGNLMLGPFMDAEQFADSFGGPKMYAAAGPVTVPPDSRMQAPYGVVRQLYRPTRLLQVIPTATMESLSFVYIREAGSLDSGPSETAEAALKPEDTGLDLSQEGTVTAVTVAGWKKLPRQVLADVQGLAVMINQRLLYEVQRRIESQIVNGTGAAGTMTGVLATSGIGSIAYAAGTPASDLVLEGMTAVRLANAEPDAVLLNPSTYAGMLSAKATGSGERLDSSGAFDSPADSLWGVPVIQSSLIDPTKAIVADWGRAVTLYIREGANVRTSDADQDDFIRNVVTVLAESRVGLAVWQPTAICEVALA